MRTLAGALLAAAVVTGVSGVPLPKVAFSVPAFAQHRSAGQRPLDQMINSFCTEGISGTSCAADLCSQLRSNEVLKQYDFDEFFRSCEATFERAVLKARAVALAAPSELVSIHDELDVWFTEKQARATRLELSILKQPGKATLMTKALGSVGAATDVCDIGFGMGSAALTALGLLPSANVHSFDSEESKESLQVHDFLEAKFPGRLALHLGDTSVLVPRFINNHPDLRCQVLFLNGDMEDFAFRDAAADLFELADHKGNGNVLVIDVPSDQGLAANVAMTIRANERRGMLTVDAVLREGPSTPAAALGKLTDGEFFAGSLVVAHFNPPSSEAEVHAIP